MLSRTHRMVDRHRVAHVLRHGKKTVTPSLVVLREPSDPPTRAAVVVSSKVSPRAVERNRIRRRIYAALETLLPTRTAHHIVIVARARARNRTTHEFAEELHNTVS